MTVTIVASDLREIHRRWLAGAAASRFGVCHQCGRHHDQAGKPLLVARQPREHHFRCFDCIHEELIP